MIQEICLTNAPCFVNSDQHILTLKKINFIFGPNGSGKSTIANEIKNEETKLNPNIGILVYNKSYREQVIKKSDDLRGLLTIGEGAVAAKEKISELSKKREKEQGKREKALKRLGGADNYNNGFIEENEKIKSQIIESLWNLRKQLPLVNGKKLFPGTYSSKTKLGSAVFDLAIKYSPNDSSGVKREALIEIDRKYSILSKAKSTEINEIVVDNYDLDLNLEGINELLEQIVLNKGDSEYVKHVSILESDTWIREGIALLNKTQPNCPFCSRGLDVELISDIKEAFSGEYEQKLAELEQFQDDCNKTKVEIGKVQEAIKLIENLDTVNLNRTLDEYNGILDEYICAIDNKFKNMSVEIHPVSNSEILHKLHSDIESLNNEIRELNNQVKDSNELERKLRESALYSLVAQGWDGIKINVQDYIKNSKAINSLADKIEEHDKRIREFDDEIAWNQEKVRSSKISLNQINRFIEYLVGNAFHLEAASNDEVANYRVVRPDGALVGDSLSEGEQQLVAFLYFMSTVWNIGVDGSSSRFSEAIVVIDDPMSSLDSDLLFGIVSVLNDLIDGVRSNGYKVKQIVCLSHSMSFYNQLTFNCAISEGDIQHFLIEKGPHGKSRVTAQDRTPIASTYAGLWEIIRNTESGVNRDAVEIPNVMRRILENYFDAGNSLRLLKNLHEDRRIDSEDAIIINSLIAWANSGSHNLLDSLEVTSRNISLESYMRVFKLIFEVTGQSAHYNMMMNKDADLVNRS